VVRHGVSLVTWTHSLGQLPLRGATSRAEHVESAAREHGHPPSAARRCHRRPRARAAARTDGCLVPEQRAILAPPAVYAGGPLRPRVTDGDDKLAVAEAVGGGERCDPARRRRRRPGVEHGHGVERPVLRLRGESVRE